MDRAEGQAPAASTVRRRLAAVLGGLALVVLASSLSLLRLPVVAFLPGPAEEVLSKVQVSGQPTFEPRGRLLLTSVGVDDSVSFYEALLDLADRDVSLAPRELFYPEGVTEAEVSLRNASDMDQSKLTATIVALRELGYDVPERPQGTRVLGVLAGGPAEGKLRIDDEIVAVDGKPVRSTAEAVEVIRARKPGEPVDLRLRREGRERSVRVVTRAAKGNPSVPLVGVTLGDHYELPLDVQVVIEDIVGPSAGLIFTLAIIDKLDRRDLTGGRTVAGTGTIDLEGRVGPVGGVHQKLVAAKRAGATVFLVPAENCEEARQVAPDGMTLVRVATVDDALRYLEQPPGAPAPGC